MSPYLCALEQSSMMSERVTEPFLPEDHVPVLSQVS